MTSCSGAVSFYYSSIGQVQDTLQAEGDNVFRDALFLFSDSLSYIHPMTKICYEVGLEMVDSFYRKAYQEFDYEDTMLNTVLYHMHIKNAYHNVVASLSNETGVLWDKIGQELGDVVQIILFDS